MVMKAGIDEAGRGPVIGPMVMAACMIDERDEFQLQTLGVKDSKLVQRKDIGRMFLLIKSLCRTKAIVISPEEIDKAILNPDDNLNKLEARTSAKLIAFLKPDVAILDCPSNNIPPYTRMVRNHIPERMRPLLRAEHQADANHAVASAASIIAKHLREEEIKKLKRTYKVNFGSGYPSDPKTIRFVKENFRLYPFFRKTWFTYKNAVVESSQSRLETFSK